MNGMGSDVTRGLRTDVLEQYCLSLVLLYHFLAVRPRTSYLPSLGLSVVIWKMQLMIILYLRQRVALVIAHLLWRASASGRVCSYYQCYRSSEEYLIKSTHRLFRSPSVRTALLRAHQPRMHRPLFQTSWQRQKAFPDCRVQLMTAT